MPYKTLQFDPQGEIALITLARPEKRNAISAEMMEELESALNESENGPARVVILTGAGSVFCAGMDIEELRAIPSQSSARHVQDARQAARLFRRLYSFSRPVIAAVNGAAIAGGCGLATLADFTLAVPEAKFGYPEVKIGFIPALVGVFLRRQIGEKAARDLLLTGRLMDAEEARARGLVNQIIPPGKLMAAARELAAKLLEASPSSLARTKRLLFQIGEAELDWEISLATHENADIRSTPDFQEGLAAFLEKRPPRWAPKG